MKDLATKINSRPHRQEAFDFSEISLVHLSNLGRSGAKLHAKEVGDFKDKKTGNPIVKFVGLRPKMYLFTVREADEELPGLNYPMEVRHNAVATGVMQSQI